MKKRITIILLFISVLANSQNDVRLIDFHYSDCDNNLPNNNNKILNQWFDGDTFKIEVSIVDDCCLDFKPFLSFEDQSLYISYKGGVGCDCMCCYQFIYYVIGLKDKDFKVKFLGQQTLIDYFKESRISDNLGQPSEIDTSYFPNFKKHRHYIAKNGKLFLWIDEENIEEAITEYGRENLRDTIIYYHHRLPDFCSDLLRKFKEPVLYNYFLNKKIIRFTWIGDVNNAIVIRLERNGDRITLITKVLKKNGRNYKEYWKDKIDISDYKKLHSLILSKELRSYFGSYPKSNKKGSEWIIEIHDMSGYSYLNRWNSDIYSEIKMVGEYLIKLSGLDKEIY